MGKRREKLLCMPLMFLLLLSIAAIYIVPVSADQTTRLYVNPPSIINQTLTPPKTFTINITLANVTKLWGWEFKLFWRNNVLNCTNDSIYIPSGCNWESPNNIALGLGIQQNYSATQGRYWKGMSALPMVKPYPVSFNGTMVLVKLTFQVLGIGSCALDLQETYLYDSEANEIVHSREDGYFDNRPPPPPALIFVDPPRIVNLTLVPCENFEVNVSIINAIYLYSFQFKLGFDPNILNITDVVLGDIFLNVTPTMEINNTAGYVWFSASLNPPKSEVSGNGTLAVITFHVEGYGASRLTLYDTALADSGGRPLPHSTSDGYFNNVLLAELAVEPPEIIDPSLMPPATFTINITLANVEDLYGYEFNLSFAPSILACLSVAIHDVLNETNYTPQFITDNIKGFIWVKVTYYPPAEPITSYPPVTLVTIKFRVKGFGATPLDLHDTSLTDSLGQPIPHEVFDGFVRIAIRDVAVINVIPSADQVYEGRTVYINVTVRNKGDLTETFNVSAYYDGNLIETQTVTDLPSGENKTLIFTWNTTGVQPCINYTIKAEAKALPYETETADNVFIDGTVKINMLGDVDGSGVINIGDMLIVCNVFGSTVEKPNILGVPYDPRADLNFDGRINIGDIVIIAINFGKTC